MKSEARSPMRIRRLNCGMTTLRQDRSHVVIPPERCASAIRVSGSAITIQSAGASLTQGRKGEEPQRKLKGTGFGHQSATGNLMLQSPFSPCRTISQRRGVRRRFPWKPRNRRDAKSAEKALLPPVSAFFASLRFTRPWLQVAAPPRNAFAPVRLCVDLKLNSHDFELRTSDFGLLHSSLPSPA